MYRYLLFDLDGTLTDPAEGITNSVKHALVKAGRPIPDHKTLLGFIGPPLYVSFEKISGMPPEEATQAVEYYREYFRERGKFENRVIEGITALLETLTGQGRRCILATSKPEVFALEIMEHFDLAKYFSYMACATLDKTRSHKADVIRYALGSCQIPCEEVIMIGDRDQDVLGAKENGIPSIGVLFGYGSREELTEAGADFIAETPEDVLRIVEKNT